MATRLEEDRNKMKDRYEMGKARIRHLQITLSEDEFLDLFEGIYHSLGGTKLHGTEVSNLFPPMKDNPLSIERSLLKTIFSREEGEISITKSLLNADETMHRAFLDLLTIGMAISTFRDASSSFRSLQPVTLYLRPRATWSTDVSSDSARNPTLLMTTLRKMQAKVHPFSRTFQWHLFPSPTVKGHTSGDTPFVLLAVVTSWNRSSTTVPNVWGYWTYLTLDDEKENVKLFSYQSFEQYKEERKAMEIETRLRAFDLYGMYKHNHFLVNVEAYNHLSIGQFVAMMSSAEEKSFDPFRVTHSLPYGELYSPFVLDSYVSQYLIQLLPTEVSKDHSDAIRCFLLTLEPLLSLPKEVSESHLDTVLSVEDILP